MTDPLIPRRDLDFLLFDWLGVGERETTGAVLGLAEYVARDLFLPHYRESDRSEPWLDADGVHILPAITQALREYAELGLPGLSFAEELGGLGLSPTIYAATYAMVAAANIATAAYPMLTVANARLIATFGSAAQIDGFARPQIEGRWTGTMCLSEPQAGSSLADIATRAVPDGEDELGARYRLTGNKMWISGADQDATENIVHLVLAKVQNADGSLPPGTKGISLFVVPKVLADGARNDVVVAGLNHKLGYRGTANCLLNLGERGGAFGWRVGEEGDGLAQMFTMMNEARVTVGTGAAALAYRGYRHSVTYARERLQGRAGGRRDGKPDAIERHPDVRRMLLQQKVYAEGALALCLFSASLIESAEHDPDAAALLSLLTPVTKSWPSEFGLIANDLAIQVHGGYGYTRDFDVEQLWRDNRLNPIHEGTAGVQAIDLLGRKLLRSNGHGAQLLGERIDRTIRAASPTLAADGAALGAAWARIGEVLDGLRTLPSAAAFNDATLFLRAFGHVVVAWLWLDQASAAAAHPDERVRDGKAAACRFFFEAELPQALTWLAIVAGHSSTAADAPDSVFD